MHKKLIYILNHYSKNSHSHFFHIINLLEEISKHGVDIALVIEKCDDEPVVLNKRITVISQKVSSKWLRPFELASILFNLTKQGYKRVFIRISWVAAVVSILVSFFSNLKTYYWLSGQGSFENYNNLKWGKEKVKLLVASKIPFAFIKKFITKFVTGPETMKTYFVEVGGVNANKVMILYNDIDISRFSKVNEKQKQKIKTDLGYKDNEKLIFFAHRFSPVRKSLFYIPYIFDRIFDNLEESFVVVMAGGGPEEDEIKLNISRSKYAERIKMIGSIPNARIHDYYQASDVFINPTYAEGFPRVLIEAMACGLPVVTTDAGGIRDIIGVKQKQYMVDKSDRDAFADRLIDLCRNEDLQSILSTENIEEVQRFSTENVAKMYIYKIFNC